MKDSLVAEGLRALRAEMPSDDSRRATLARLGLNDTAAQGGASKRGEPVTGSRGGIWRWLVLGVLLGLAALLLQRFG